MSDGEKIHQTMYETMQAINNNDYLKVVDLIGAPLALKNDTSNIRFEVAHIYYILTKYHHNNIDSLRWDTDNKIDGLGRIKYTVPIFQGFDSTTGIQKMTLNLYFGPPDYFPLKKLTGFENDVEVDDGYRGALIDANKFVDIEDLVDSIKRSK